MNQREIKFRVWDETGQEMIGPNDFYQNADMLPNGDKTGCHLSDFFGMNGDGTTGKEHERIVIEQFTGLKDKNDKEIYEGDIVKCANDSQGVFVWSQKMGMWRIDTTQTIDGWAHPIEGFDSDSLEIIGNIHENPELLK